MVAQFVDPQPDRDGETRADHRDSNRPGSYRPGIGTGLRVPTAPTAPLLPSSLAVATATPATELPPARGFRRPSPPNSVSAAGTSRKSSPGGAGIHRCHASVFMSVATGYGRGKSG